MVTLGTSSTSGGPDGPIRFDGSVALGEGEEDSHLRQDIAFISAPSGFPLVYRKAARSTGVQLWL